MDLATETQVSKRLVFLLELQESEARLKLQNDLERESKIKAEKELADLKNKFAAEYKKSLHKSQLLHSVAERGHMHTVKNQDKRGECRRRVVLQGVERCWSQVHGLPHST